MKTIAINGGTGELGHAVLPRLLRDARCIVLYRDEPSWLRLRDAIRDGDMIGVANVNEIAEDVDAIVNLAGAFTLGASPDDFSRMLDANLLSAVKTIDGVRLRDGGRIIAISSIASLAKPAGLGAYVASKAALNAYLEVLAKELAPRKITVNALAPSTLDTATMRKASPNEPRVPLDRVAETIAFLLSDAAGSVSGQIIAMR